MERLINLRFCGNLFLKQKLYHFCFIKTRSLIFDTNIICFLFQMGKHPKSADSLVWARIQQNGPGWVFTPSSFHDLGSRTAVALALSRHKRDGTIRQLARGLYDYPQKDPQLGLLSPSTDAIAAALKGRDALRLQPSGGYAANLLGLSEQVPMKLLFLTDGPNRLVKLGHQTIQLRHTTPRNVATAGRISGLVTQALRHLGQGRVNDTMVALLQRRLTEADKAQLQQDIAFAPAWMWPILRRLSPTLPSAA